jgi:feruloyl esterase
MKSSVLACATAAASLVAAQEGAVSSSAAGTAASCSSLTAPAVPGANIIDFSAREVQGLQVPSFTGQLVTVPAFCGVNITVTHGNAGDRVRTEVWMPLEGWNRRFQGTGGGGYIAGTFGQAMAPEVANGYAAASTDAGVVASANGTTMNTSRQLLVNFASLSVHEMAIIGKDVVRQFYGMPAMFSYWNGCSTGGRQGMMEAQAFPEDFNGILAVAPAINWAKFVPASFFPLAVMNQAGTFPPACVYDMIQQATINACDEQDGAKDGIVAQPGGCRFDVATLVGRSIACANASSVTITKEHIDVYNQIVAGPVSRAGKKVWYGLLPGSSFNVLAGPEPFTLAEIWVRDFVLSGNLSQTSTPPQALNLAAVNAAKVNDIVQQSQEAFDVIIGTDNPNLSGFKNAGGKLLTWHGLADQLIFPNGTFDYVQRVYNLMGGREQVDSFYRVFGAPGIQHCGGGPGAMPTDPLSVLVDWVEKGIAPDTLPAARVFLNASIPGAPPGFGPTAPGNDTSNMPLARNLCRYPQIMEYRGTGDQTRAESWRCVAGPTQDVVEERTLSQTGLVIATAAAPKESYSIGSVLMAALILTLNVF